MSGVNAYYQETVKIPGFGGIRSRCRPYKAVGFCENGHPVLGRSSCETYGCPDHFRDAVQRATISAVARLAAYRQARGGRIVHAVASPPQEGRWGEDRLWKSRSEAYSAAKAAGVPGGAAVLHPYRVSERGEALFEGAAEAGEAPGGKWRTLREMADDWEEMQDYVTAGPHTHIIGPAPDVDGSGAPEGWVVERIRSCGPTGFHIRDTEAYREIAKAAFYVLTHAATGLDRKALTYYGELHPAKFRPEDELTAAEWERIQIEAERAVKTRPSDGRNPEPAGTITGQECRVGDCEGEVLDLGFLREYLEDEEWVGTVLRQPKGRKRFLRLRGLLIWLFEGGDRPPPQVQASEARLREWLEDQGRRHTARPGQRRLGDHAVGEIPARVLDEV